MVQMVQMVQMVAMRQLNLAVFCVAALLFCTSSASMVNDDNAIVELAFQTYYKAINMSGWYKYYHYTVLYCIVTLLL